MNYVTTPRKASIPADMRHLRDVKRWGKTTYYYDSMEEFDNIKSIRSGIYTIKSAKLFYDFNVANRRSRVTLIIFHPAIPDRAGKKLPFFVGAKISADAANLIMVSDPTLYLHREISCGWYSGGTGYPVQAVMPELLGKFLTLLGSELTIFTGISGGGFASLLFSHSFPGSLAIPINPVTKLGITSRYAFNILKRRAFPGMADEQFLDRTICSSLREKYSAPFHNKILYIQNYLDHFREIHAKPFFSAVDSDSRCNIKVLYGKEWGAGHIAPNATYMKDILATASSAHDATSALDDLPGVMLASPAGIAHAMQ
ncbi:hypothetical protein ACUSIJ_23990 [Pseudochelatococcus sp. B33]